MSDFTIGKALGETRQAMLRVWMAISAVWVTFWLSIVAIIVMTNTAMANPLLSRLDHVALVVVAPPLILLAIGTILRCGFEMFVWKLGRR